jgi:hypothetical protein
MAEFVYNRIAKSEKHKNTEISKMYKQPETFEDILNYPTEDPSNYKITKQLRFLLVGCKIFGLKTMGDLRKKERWVLQKYEFWRRKNKKHLGKAYFMSYDAGIDLMR